MFFFLFNFQGLYLPAAQHSLPLDCVPCLRLGTCQCSAPKSEVCFVHAYSQDLPRNSVSVARAAEAQARQPGGRHRGLGGGCPSGDVSDFPPEHHTSLSSGFTLLSVRVRVQQVKSCGWMVFEPLFCRGGHSLRDLADGRAICKREEGGVVLLGDADVPGPPWPSSNFGVTPQRSSDSEVPQRKSSSKSRVFPWISPSPSHQSGHGTLSGSTWGPCTGSVCLSWFW